MLTTPTLGNICQLCDERIQIFHRLDDGGHESSSDVEIEVVENTNKTLPMQLVDSLAKGNFAQRAQRPETPVIVDDDDMLFNMFMQKFDQKNQLQRQQMETSLPQNPLNPVDGQYVHQFHAPYTPPQSTAGGSEGDETKVIEVLTSHESTPGPRTTTTTPQTLAAPSSHGISNSNMVDSQGHRIVAIIELDDNDENEQKNHESERNHSGLLTPATSSSNELSFTESIDHRSGLLSPNKSGFIQSPTKVENSQQIAAGADDDDEEIVFRKVDGVQEKSTTNKKRKRKSYDEKELRLVASLSLVSSDSEVEDDRPLKAKKHVENHQNEASGPASTQNVLNLVVNNATVSCKVCKLKLPDSESLSVHELVHQGVKCILCQVGFQQVKRLIYHMRRKHREYNGDALFEKPRSGQDSCMTIRLRYMQRTTFYECQLCGRIDEVFREHKEHIIEKHANESKTLKDPIMKQLKCPVCKEKCGAQYLSLCRHLISTHDYQQYKSHLRELVHVSAFGWNAARQQEVAKTAKIFQFIKRKTFFFECKICRKVVAGYLHHLRHVNKHQNAANEKTNIKSTTSTSNSNEIPPDRTFPNEGAVDPVGISKKLQKLDNKSKKNSKLNNKSMQIDKVKVKENAKKLLKSKADEEEKSKLKTKQTKFEKSKKNTIAAKSSETEVEIKDTKKKIQIKLNIKPKEKLIKKLPNVEKSTKGKTKKDIKSKNIKDEKVKGKTKQKHNNELKPQVKKVKVKPPIRQVDLPKFKCKYCLKKIKGFRLYNLHLLQQHKENEYTKCNTCNKIFTNTPTNKLNEHIKQCTHLLPASFKVKRKYCGKSTHSEDISEPCVKKVPEHNESFVDKQLEDSNRWLKDLLQLRKASELESVSVSNSTNTALCIPYKQTNLQCCYCLHLFANDQNLKEHTKLQHSQQKQQPQILIRYKPLKTIIN